MTGTNISYLKGQHLDVNRLLEEVHQEMSSQRKNKDALSKMYHEKRVNKIDEGIRAAKRKERELNRSSWFQFAIQMVSQVVQWGSQAISAIFPKATLLIRIAGDSIQGFLKGLLKWDPMQKKAVGFEFVSKEKNKEAEIYYQKFNLEKERGRSVEHSHDVVKRNLEKTIDQIQKSHEVSTKI